MTKRTKTALERMDFTPIEDDVALKKAFTQLLMALQRRSFPNGMEVINHWCECQNCDLQIVRHEKE